MMQAIVKVCLAATVTMGALMAGTASGPRAARAASEDAVPMATCDDATCDSNCIAAGNCEGVCRANGTCRCIPHQGGFCP